MGRLLLILPLLLAILYTSPHVSGNETVLSAVLTPKAVVNDTKKLQRQSRSYYDGRYGVPRPLYERLEYEQPSRCGRCSEDRDRDSDRSRDSDRPRDRYDDDRRSTNRPTYGNRLDRNRNNGRDDEDRRYNNERRNGDKTNGTSEEQDDDKSQYDGDNDDRRQSSSTTSTKRDRDRGNHRNRYDDRDRYRPDYYDRFLRDPYRERGPSAYEDPYRERRPLYERNPYDRYDEVYAYRRPVYDDRYDRGNAYDDGYGGYAPGVGRGPHDRPWDETYRGQSGWDDGGRGYYFASGRPDAGAATPWGQQEYARPTQEALGWQNVHQGGYRDPLEYRGGYSQDPSGYRQDPSGYRQDAAYRPSGWHSVGERRPYRDQSGVNNLDKGGYGQPRPSQSSYAQDGYGQTGPYGQNTAAYGQKDGAYGQNNGAYGQNTAAYGQNADTYRQNSDTYRQNGNRPQSSSSGTSGSYSPSSSTTPGTSYLYEREDSHVTAKETSDATTKTPS